MPNGMDRDFVRFMSCIASFREKFNRWPTRVRLDPGFPEELRDVMGLRDYQKLVDKIQLIADSVHPNDGTFIAEDNQEKSYDLLVSGHFGNVQDAVKWLNIEWPDYYGHYVRKEDHD